MGRLHGRDHGVHDNGNVRTVYTAVQGPCTWSIHDPNTVVSRSVHGGHVHARVYGPCSQLFTACTVHTVVFKACTRPLERSVYTAVHGPCTVHAVYHAHGRLYGLCTRPCTAVNVPGTRPCTGHVTCTWACLRFRPITWHFLRPVYTAVYGPCTRPCTGCVHGRP